MADSPVLFTLLESAAGYAVFEVIQFDEIAALLLEDAVTDIKRFGRSVKLTGFYPFSSAAEALENANAISEHACTDALHSFLELQLPSIKKSKKTAPFSLGVIDPALATAIMERMPGLTCRSDDTIREIGRGCRVHLDTFVKGLSVDTGGSVAIVRAQLGLGHSYSRSKVKFNPARSDNMIIQSIALLDQLDKDVNTFAMRVREWYAWHFPELKELVKDNVMFARAAAYIQDKNTLFTSSADTDTDMTNGEGDKTAGLVEILGGDEELAAMVIAAAKTSMGMDCSPLDMINIVNFTTRMIKLAEYRKQLAVYLSDKMSVVAPNLAALIGDSVAARLISKAGSLNNLAKAPASTVQILGAEKALFRALKTKGNTPKYGLIYHSTFIGRADAKNKGRISRYLANKCSIATRIDSFSDNPNSLYGEKLRDQVEERLKFYETGAAPRRNIDVMEDVAKQLKAGKKDDLDDDDDVVMDDALAKLQKSDKKKKKDKKKDKKRKSTGGDDDDDKDDEKEKKSAKKEKKKKKKSM